MNKTSGTSKNAADKLVNIRRKAQHINTLVSATGRHCTNAWDFAGFSSLGPQHDEELAIHPTVKPVALLADAIRDCSKRGDAMLDVFGGSGSTLITADQCGRVARLIEIDPLYCDRLYFLGECLLKSSARSSFCA